MAAPDLNPLPDQLVHLIVRFAASIPDLSLPIPSPRTTTTLSLKQLIRPNLPPSLAASRLRLIYAGKVLADAAPLSTSLRLPPPPPSRDRTHIYQDPGSNDNGKGKGKLPVKDTAGVSPNVHLQQEAKKYYIHCSLGDALSASELSAEASTAHASELSLQHELESSDTKAHRRSISGGISGRNDGRRRGSTTTAPAPQGFDRLLASGFTAQEVASLRSHFQTNLSYTHTPDTMPSQTEMRALEDRWLDSTATDPSPALTGEADAGWGAGFTVEEGGLDDMLYGYLTGFFWPLGALIWGFREEGVWPRRRQLAVAMGVVLNAAFGFMRWSS
ncbi:hypothetical protein BU24DRAFT_420163 [Aaosphaeria arxii CBS 175.79]|uniref:Ubiquitin-like domain-containing protein n=1 Tax=Aaosphaeria arxii CBS 175.79 TaxID=1450172 RepID=A0A6A5XWX2_9PLEO|nr:uncharacterized protein BU24DRAFT_420163 [Aaosphaeria arxii CBS 175.79]KAF2017140.1 hypothetical protein BU24DRAFT_420163 [Aaosphaeria arxii CBS 175.79]